MESGFPLRVIRSFFSEKTDDLEIPPGIPVLAVDPTAEADGHRKSLFAQLGVRVCQVTEICSLIRDLDARS